jgi:hypothetical protein
MSFRAISLAAAGILTLVLGAMGLAGAARAGTIEVVSADGEYAKAHPKPVVAQTSGEDFAATMDRVFGQGRWRETGGYRTRAQENALRRRGAGTVAPGHISLHSVGDEDSPGAYDAVVDHMSPGQAAAKLRRSGAAFSRVVAEGAHGPEGPHLHVELVSAVTRRGAAGSAADE